MEATLIFFLILVLAGVAYTQWRRSAVRTVDAFSLDAEENHDLMRVATKPQQPVC